MLFYLLTALSTSASPSVNNQPVIPLQDIHLPKAVHEYPIAYGWWALLFLLIALIIWLIINVKKRRALHQSKKQALSALNAQTSPADTILLLKWAAMQYFNREELAKLYGLQLQQYLAAKLSDPYKAEFIQLTQQSFSQLYTRENTTDKSQLSDCHIAARVWLTQALPPKKTNLQESKHD